MICTMTDNDILDYDFFADDKDCDGVVMHTSKIVVTYKEHTCMFMPHTQHVIPIGSRSRVDKALVDGKWRSFYSCIDCHEKYTLP